jgi:CBS domain-containing protein
MQTIDAVRRPGVSISADQTVTEAAELMEQGGVGALVVADEAGAVVGIVTDRDLVRRAMARGLPGDARVDGVMSLPPITIEHDRDLHEAFGVFREHAIRRLPVLDQGRFVGMLTVDDLLVNLAGHLADLARPVTAEVIFGDHEPPGPVVPSPS